MRPAVPRIHAVPLPRPSRAGIRPGSGARSFPQTNSFERLLLLLTIAVTPILDTLPSLGEFSIAWIWFTAIGGYVLLERSRALQRAWQQRIFLVAYCFIAAGVVMEMLHPNPDFRDLIRFVQTIGGAVIISALCRDRRAMQAGLYGFLLLACLLTAVLLVTSYGDLRAADVEGFEEASQLRGSVYRREGVEDLLKDLNRVSFLCGLGALVALGLAAKSPRNNLIWFGVAIFCLLGTFLPLSRSGILIVGLAGLAILFARRGKGVEALFAVIVIAACLYAIAPTAVFERFRTYDSQPGKVDLRQKIFEGILRSLPEFYLSGVGTNDYWNGWAVQKGIATRANKPLGAHNSMFQVWIYWGLPGLLTFVALLWAAYRCLPRGCGRDVLALCLLGLALAMVIRLSFTHAFYVKDFTAVAGLLAAARLWIWPSGAVLISTRIVQRPEKVFGYASS